MNVLTERCKRARVEHWKAEKEPRREDGDEGWMGGFAEIPVGLRHLLAYSGFLTILITTFLLWELGRAVICKIGRRDDGRVVHFAVGISSIHLDASTSIGWSGGPYTMGIHSQRTIDGISCLRFCTLLLLFYIYLFIFPTQPTADLSF